jgi:hypothetical protein
MKRLRSRIGPERVAMQVNHVEHRPEIKAAAEERIFGRESFDQPLRRQTEQSFDVTRG